MHLTADQQTALRNAILADPVLSLLTPSGDNADAIAVAYKAITTPTWYVYRTNVPKDEVMNYIDWAKMTPGQAIPASGDAIHIFNAKTLVTATKQMNLQNLLINDKPINFALTNVRSGFQDSLTQLPTKNDGTTQAAGWAQLQLVISEPANRLEKLFSAGTGSQASPATRVVQGTLTYQEVGLAMGWSV